MNIIRDDNQEGSENPQIAMLPLLVSWGVNRCNIEGCTNKPTTIIAGTEAGVFGMCEKHYQEAKATKGKYKMKLEF